MQRNLPQMLFALGLTACGARSALPTEDTVRSTAQRTESADAAALVDAWAGAPSASGYEETTSRLAAAPFKVALFGDQGVSREARRVLQLVAAEHVDLLILLGDLLYNESSPNDWEAQLDGELGPNFPVLAVIGNHDRDGWAGDAGLETRLRQRLSRMSEAQCEGEYGVKASCTFRGVSFVFSGVGTVGGEHEQYVDSALQRNDALFRTCVWHKNQHDMQVGAKQDEVGWEAYRICARHGAPIFTGHEHSYSRTQSLAAIGEREQMHGATGETTELDLMPGRTFAVVSGLGGQSRRERTMDHERDGWWASVYARDAQLRNGEVEGTKPQIEDGALFVVFRADGEADKAYGYFKTVDGAIHDEFSWRAQSQHKADAQVSR